LSRSACATPRPGWRPLRRCRRSTSGAQARQIQVFLVGGTVRELILGGRTPDLDLAVSRQTLDLAQELARALGGTYVLLDETERTARVVAGAATLDLAEFRGASLEADLRGRDFTINAMALDLAALLAGEPVDLIDPCGGWADLAAGQVRMVAAANLASDPLRLLRAYRFAATHGFTVTAETATAIRDLAPALARVAGERVHYELMQLLAAPRAAPGLRDLDRVGLLSHIFPELLDLKGVAQDGYHHLDVFEHSLETVAQLEAGAGRAGATFFRVWRRPSSGWPRTRCRLRCSRWRPCFTMSANPRCRSAGTNRGASPFITMSGWGWKSSSGRPGGCASARPRSRP
jgi:poly(A) polymerase